MVFQNYNFCVAKKPRLNNCFCNQKSLASDEKNHQKCLGFKDVRNNRRHAYLHLLQWSSASVKHKNESAS